MIITISGTAGSGKSSIAKILVEKLKAKRIYVGGMRRKLAKEMGMTLLELNEYAKTHKETDVDVDKKAATEARLIQGNVVVEGRTMFHFLPESVKVFVKSSPDEAAKRIWKDLQNKKARLERNEGRVHSLQEMYTDVIRRDSEDAKRFSKYYGIDHRDESNYDFVLDTTQLTIKQGVDKVMKFIEQTEVN